MKIPKTLFFLERERERKMPMMVFCYSFLARPILTVVFMPCFSGHHYSENLEGSENSTVFLSSASCCEDSDQVQELQVEKVHEESD